MPAELPGAEGRNSLPARDLQWTLVNPGCDIPGKPASVETAAVLTEVRRRGVWSGRGHRYLDAAVRLEVPRAPCPSARDASSRLRGRAAHAAAASGSVPTCTHTPPPPEERPWSRATEGRAVRPPADDQGQTTTRGLQDGGALL